jgi:two-component system, chemotaxis family, protein-glutamate methylesterase/glutaminase
MEEAIINRYELLIIGGSAGSLEVLLKILPKLPAGFPMAVAIIVHRKVAESQLAELLSDRCKLPLHEAEDKETILPGTVYLAPADYHLLIEKTKTFSLDYSEKINYSRPSIDVSFETAAEAYGNAVIGILLSGANADGAEGLRSIKKAGGVVIAQDPEEAAVSYMPQQAIGRFSVDYIAKAADMIEIVERLTGKVQM